MKKIILILTIALILALSAAASEEILVGTPIIDGIVDTMYLESYKIELTGDKNTFYTSKGSTADGAWGDSATAYYLYDEGHLYVCINVNDDAVFSRGKPWIVRNIKALSWENDAVEARIYYPELGEAVQANQYIFQCDAMGIAATNYLAMCTEEFKASTTVRQDGYTVEFALPLSFGKKAGDEIGLAVEIDDIHEQVWGGDTPVGGHKFNAYGSQHPYKNMVKLGTEKVANKITVFDDTREHWGRNDISYMLQTGLFNGMGKGFEPDTEMSRAMFVTVLGRMAEMKSGELDEYGSVTEFSDTDYRAWYGKYVKWATGAGLVGGFDDGTFRPDDPITREQMATVLFRYSKAANVTAELTFADADSISEWAKPGVQYCLNKGYIGGDNNNNFAPSNNATRAEVSTLITRVMQKSEVQVY